MRSSAARVIAAVALALVATARVAAACPGDGVEAELGTWRFAIAPRPAHGVGLDLWDRGPAGAWGACDGPRHRVESIEFEAPDVGDRDHTYLHAGGYRLRLPAGGGATVELGGWLLALVAGEARLVTPVVAVTAAPAPRVVIHVELAASGAYLMAPRAARPRAVTDDWTLAADLAWPADAATRGELRLRARHYRDRRDLTVTAGLGLALGARDGVRAVPGLLGLAARLGDDPALLVVAELGFGARAR